MRASARPSAGQTALLLSMAKIEDEEETGRTTATKERKSRCTTRAIHATSVLPLCAKLTRTNRKNSPWSSREIRALHYRWF